MKTEDRWVVEVQDTNTFWWRVGTTKTVQLALLLADLAGQTRFPTEQFPHVWIAPMQQAHTALNTPGHVKQILQQGLETLQDLGPVIAVSQGLRMETGCCSPDIARVRAPQVDWITPGVIKHFQELNAEAARLNAQRVQDSILLPPLSIENGDTVRLEVEGSDVRVLVNGELRGVVPPRDIDMRIAKLETRLAQMTSFRDNLQRDRKKLLEDNLSLSAQRSSLQKELQIAKEEGNTAVGALNDELNRVLALYAEAVKHRDSAITDNVELKAEIQRSVIAVKSLNDTLTRAFAESEQLRRDAALAKVEVNDLTNAIADHECKHSIAVDTLERVKQERDAAVAERNSLRTKVVDLQPDVRRLDALLRNEQNEVARLTALNDGITKELHAAIALKDAAEKDNRELAAALKEKGALEQIKSNTCPYCGSPYTVADGGCRLKCPNSQVHARLVNAAARQKRTRSIT